MTDTLILVAGLNCSGCVNTLTKRLLQVPGVTSVSVALASGGASTVHITSSSVVASEDIEASIIAAGKRVV